MPEYISLCLESVRKTASPCEMILVTPKNLCTYIPSGTIHKNLEILRVPAQRADCIRAALLSLYGGFYYDADTIGLRSPIDVAIDHDLVYCVWSNPPRRVLNGYVYAKENSEVAAQWLEEINQKLSEIQIGKKIHWVLFGEPILTNLINKNPGTTKQIPRYVFLPIDVDNDVRSFFSKIRPDRYIKPESVCFGLNHSWMMKNKRIQMEMDRRRMALSPVLIHQLFTQTRKRLALIDKQGGK